MTLDQLRDRAGLTCGRPSMSKKLRGRQAILVETGEAAALAGVLGYDVVWDERSKAFQLRKASKKPRKAA